MHTTTYPVVYLQRQRLLPLVSPHFFLCHSVHDVRSCFLYFIKFSSIYCRVFCHPRVFRPILLKHPRPQKLPTFSSLPNVYREIYSSPVSFFLHSSVGRFTQESLLKDTPVFTLPLWKKMTYLLTT